MIRRVLLSDSQSRSGFEVLCRFHVYNKIADSTPEGPATRNVADTEILAVINPRMAGTIVLRHVGTASPAYVDDLAGDKGRL